jgi:cation diffusion facilitator CzcD-associated flavoprotein CzcO
MHHYSLSTDPNPDWEYTNAFQPEILGYWKGLCDKHDIYSRAVFNTSVVKAEWDDSRKLYHITVQDVSTRLQRVLDAEILISAVGVLGQPNIPDIPGLDTFKGPLFHSAHWDKSLNLSGKRIGVVGNGSSAYVFHHVLSFAIREELNNLHTVFSSYP